MSWPDAISRCLPSAGCRMKPDRCSVRRISPLGWPWCWPAPGCRTARRRAPWARRMPTICGTPRRQDHRDRVGRRASTRYLDRAGAADGPVRGASRTCPAVCASVRPDDARILRAVGGHPSRSAIAAFDTLGTALTPVRTPIGDAWILSHDEPLFRAAPGPAAPARLLPSGDTWFFCKAPTATSWCPTRVTALRCGRPGSGLGRCSSTVRPSAPGGARSRCSRSSPGGAFPAPARCGRGGSGCTPPARD